MTNNFDATFLNRPKIDALELEDIESLTPVLETWIKKDGNVIEEEVEQVKHAMRDSIEGKNGYTYLVMRNENGSAIGVMGLRRPEDRMMQYASTDNPIELVNAFISQEYRGRGLGKKLISKLFEKAKELGHKEVILNSGPRYKGTAWDFYFKVMGEPVAVAPNYYGERRHAPVWRKILV